MNLRYRGYDILGTYDIVGTISTYDVVIYDIVGPSPDLRYRILSSYVMSSVLTNDVVRFVHYVVYDIAHDVCIDSNSGV